MHSVKYGEPECVPQPEHPCPNLRLIFFLLHMSRWHLVSADPNMPMVPNNKKIKKCNQFENLGAITFTHGVVHIQFSVRNKHLGHLVQTDWKMAVGAQWLRNWATDLCRLWVWTLELLICHCWVVALSKALKLQLLNYILSQKHEPNADVNSASLKNKLLCRTE